MYLRYISIIFGDRDILKTQIFASMKQYFSGKLGLFHTEVSFDTSEEK